MYTLTPHYIYIYDYKDDQQQLGFKANSSCPHAMFILKQLINKSKRMKKRLYVTAIDASKAFDKVPREILWNRMRELGINPTVILAIESYSCSMMMVIKIEEISSTNDGLSLLKYHLLKSIRKHKTEKLLKF